MSRGMRLAQGLALVAVCLCVFVPPVGAQEYPDLVWDDSVETHTVAEGNLPCYPSTEIAASPQALYPLFDDLADATGNYGDAVLHGNPTPPTPPDGINPLCLNGIYVLLPQGQDMTTPPISSLDETDLQIDIQFILNELPSFWTTVIMIGPNTRWFGLYIDGDGLIGAKYNNSSIIWSSTTVGIHIWHAAQLKYESGTLQIVLDGAPIMLASIGPLTTGSEYIFTCNDFSNAAGPVNGCIRNLNIYNDTTIVVEDLFSDSFESGDTSAWSATVP